MGLLTTLGLTLGPAIAKTLVKRWLKDSEIASDASAEVIDLLKGRTTDVLAQRKAAREFEAMGEKIAESLKDVFDLEGRAIDEGQLEFIARQVADTLNKAQITSQFLVENNFEPEALSAYLLQSNPAATFTFDEVEKALYKRILQETSQYIIDVSSQLPAFEERTFAELFKRNNQLLNVTEQILDEVRRIRSTATEGDAKAARFEADYRRAVVRALDELQLFGVDVSSVSRRQRLSIAYITLSVKRDAPAGRELAAAADAFNAPLHLQAGDDVSEGLTMPADEVLRESQRLLIIGEAGSGKTTLLQWVAVSSAQKDFKGSLAEYNDSIPFFIRLRQCAESGLPGPEDFTRFVAPSITGAMPQGWVHDQMESGKAIVLIDGLDELGEAMREDVRMWLKDLVGTYTKSRFIVSSRPYAAESSWMAGEGFESAELLPMELGDINAFVDHWHMAIQEHVTDEEQKNQINSLKDNLKEKVRKSPQIRKLAKNPLLCAMLCAINRDRKEILPTDRVELYDACLYMLIERRDIERKVVLSDYPVLPYRSKRVLLEDLSYWLMKNGHHSLAPVGVIDGRLSQKLVNMRMVGSNAEGSEVRRLFVERSGVLREPVKGQIDFTHRTFQEFLGAKAALDEDDIGLLVNNAHEQLWREVIILASGQANAKQRGDLIGRLIERGDNDPAGRHQFHLLAVACMEGAVELANDITELVVKRLVALIPPKNMTEAKALASAGDLAIPYLTYQASYSSAKAAACARALWLIGGETALEYLRPFAHDRRTKVCEEIIRGWDNFDREVYAKNVLREVASYTDSGFLRISRVDSIEGIQHLDKLQRLSLFPFFYADVDLSPLVQCPHLSKLKLGYFSYLDLRSLSALNLDELELFACYSIEHDSLASLQSLTSLVLWRMYPWYFIEVGKLPNLRRLSIVQPFTHKVDLSFVSSLKKLEVLTLENIGIADLSPLSDLPNLKQINISSMMQGIHIPASLASKVSITSI